MITQERLKEVLEYDPKTGVFTWLLPVSNRIRVGSIAGCRSQSGYNLIGIDGVIFRSHRLAWLYVYGYFPENCIDHSDRDTHNNRINNLREVSVSCNIRNSKTSKRNTSGVRGVYWNKKRGKWLASIRVSDKQRHLGLTEDFLEAVCLRLAGEQSVGWAGCDSSTPAYQYVQEYIRTGVIL